MYILNPVCTHFKLHYYVVFVCSQYADWKRSGMKLIKTYIEKNKQGQDTNEQDKHVQHKM